MIYSVVYDFEVDVKVEKWRKDSLWIADTPNEAIKA